MTENTLRNNSKIYDSSISLDKAVEIRNNTKIAGKTFALTNGCFDLLHSGHVFSLEQASKLADVLWVMLNSDSSVKNLKGNKRPIVKERDRAYLLNSLEFVSGVTIFNSPRLDQEILALSPDIYIKSGDYNKDTIERTELDALKKVRSKIEFVSFLPDKNTTSLIDEILLKFNL